MMEDNTLKKLQLRRIRSNIRKIKKERAALKEKDATLKVKLELVFRQIRRIKEKDAALKKEKDNDVLDTLPMDFSKMVALPKDVASPKDVFKAVSNTFAMLKALRLRRKDCADLFRTDYTFDSGQKVCIGSSGGFYSWPDNKCYDALWVGVHGMDSICVIIRHKDLDVTRAGPLYKHYCTNEQTIRNLTETVISEIEGLPYDDKLREKFGKSIEKPFGVVSFPDSKKVHEDGGHEASSTQYDEEKAITYLTEKMKSGSPFTYDETIQTAISAFQHLCREELKAEDFWVCVLKKADSKHWPCKQREELLSVINGCSSSSGGSTNITSGSEGSTNIASGNEGSMNIATVGGSGSGSGGGQIHVVELMKKSIAHCRNQPCS